MKTRSGKDLNGNYTNRKRKNDQGQPEGKKLKTNVATKTNWDVLPTLAIQKIYLHLLSKESDKCFVKLGNQMSVNQHWQRAVQIEAHRTHLTLNSIRDQTKLCQLLKNLTEKGLKNLKHLRLHNMNSQFSRLQRTLQSEPFQLDSLFITDDSSRIEGLPNQLVDFFGHCQNLQSFTAKQVGLTQYQFSMVFGLKSLTKLVLQIPLRPVTAEQPFAGFPTENHCLNIEGLTSLTHLDVECTQTPTQENYFTENWKALENGKPWIKYGHLSPNIQFLRLKFTDIWISCIEDSGRRDLMAVNDEFQSQYMKKLKYLSLEAFTVLQSSAILKNLVSQAPLDYVHVDDSVSGNYGITESVWIPQLQVSVRIKSLQSLRWPRGVVGRATARIRGIRRR